MIAQPKRTRPRGFALWTPRPESLALVQAEALDPATLAGIVREAITARRDFGAEAEALAREAEHRAALVAKLGGRADD